MVAPAHPRITILYGQLYAEWLEDGKPIPTIRSKDGLLSWESAEAVVRRLMVEHPELTREIGVAVEGEDKDIVRFPSARLEGASLEQVYRAERGRRAGS